MYASLWIISRKRKPFDRGDERAVEAESRVKNGSELDVLRRRTGDGLPKGTQWIVQVRNRSFGAEGDMVCQGLQRRCYAVIEIHRRGLHSIRQSGGNARLTREREQQNEYELPLTDTFLNLVNIQ